MPRILKIAPNVCPCCRSVQTELLKLGVDATYQCHSCHKKYVQHFIPSTETIDYITDEAGGMLWDSNPKRRKQA